MSWFRWGAKPITHQVSGGYATNPFVRDATNTSTAPAFILPPANGISDGGYLGITIVAEEPHGTRNPKANRTIVERPGWHPLV